MLEIKTVTNGPIPMRVQRVCHDTLPLLISVSLDVTAEFATTVVAQASLNQIS